jgi:hypothetical protein
MFSAVEDPNKVYYLLLDMSQEDLEKVAEESQYYMKLVNESIKYKYTKTFKEKYEPFRSKDRQELMSYVLEKQINLIDLK